MEPKKNSARTPWGDGFLEKKKNVQTNVEASTVYITG